MVVPLEERGALGLTVVGEDHDVIGPWCFGDCIFETRELRIQALQAMGGALL